MAAQNGSHYPICVDCGQQRPFEGKVRFDARPCPFCGGDIKWTFIADTPREIPEGLERIRPWTDKCTHEGTDHITHERTVCDARTIIICARCGREVA